MAVVALRKESVDRNQRRMAFFPPGPLSLSARRAWIEIQAQSLADQLLRPSLSARRAWIEICKNWQKQSIHHKSLSARRAWIEIQ